MKNQNQPEVTANDLRDSIDAIWALSEWTGNEEQQLKTLRAQLREIETGHVMVCQNTFASVPPVRCVECCSFVPSVYDDGLCSDCERMHSPRLVKCPDAVLVADAEWLEERQAEIDRDHARLDREIEDQVDRAAYAADLEMHNRDGANYADRPY